MNKDQAEIVAYQAVGFIAEDEDRLGRFLALSGVGPFELRERMRESAFLGGVLDFLLNFEPDLMAFAESAELEPELVAKARAVLPGAPIWE